MTSFETVHNGDRGRQRLHQEDLDVDPCDPKFPEARLLPSTSGCRQPANHLQQSFPEMRIEASKPVVLLGGQQHISTLGKPFPNISMVASRGITIGLSEEPNK
ncbi:uncharacterized protein LOC116255102 [Nymphaea colorata]|nr:uncharacterized protein LOC116255102 [Nymphaea colorata]